MTDHETHRHACEVRDVIRRAKENRNPGAWVEGYLVKVEKARGKEAADRLRADARAGWRS